MVDILSKLTAAPQALTYKGTRYEISPLGLRELAQVKSFLKRHIMEEAKRDAAALLEAGAPAECLKQLWDDAMRWYKNPLAAPCIEDEASMTEFIALSLRKRHPEVTLTIVQDMLSDPNLLAELSATAQGLNSVETDIKNP